MAKLSKPDFTFRMTVNPVYRVYSCPEKLAEEARGLMGWHAFTRCPNCRLEFEGWAFWGENGHQQNTTPTRERLIHYLKLMARKRWMSTQYPGKVWGHTFKMGSPIYYAGGKA